ncbi:activator of 90 kDa heat shock protein ATPase homolog 1 [Condylostylus longicornis]|uniref:activator of 90 kDa heat shock protein ATPase homolog 1 n=1 Tax=Condylostylus longicornis TaxID=2530218 RepID=UPI00244E04D5|nr:activator of 90 kDa heat shock protein ATPase homolog 1 [Condylostylus longicornis]
MAKWGEGDPRWIVEERPDATNVNNWHWTEKNATPWSKDRLKSLFTNYKIAESNCEVTIEVDTCNGEATANNRKGKLIFFYEWNIVLLWSGKLSGCNEVHKGKASIPNLSEENDLDEIEITISVNESNQESEQLKVFMYNVGRQKIRDQIGVYLKELKQEYSKGLILPKKEDGKVVKPDSVNTITSGFNKKIDINKFKSGSDIIRNDNNNFGCKIDCKTLNLKVDFQCRSNDIYNVLTRPEMVSAFTRSEVKLNPSKGGEFVLFGGNVHGHFKELIPNVKIVQTWRLKQWPDGHYSDVVIDIEEKEDHTELRLTQTGVPSSEVDMTTNNWKRYYWNSIKQTFGFGIPSMT